MDAESLRKRIIYLRGEKERLISQINIVEGAAQEAEYMLSLLTRPKEGESKPPLKKVQGGK